MNACPIVEWLTTIKRKYRPLSHKRPFLSHFPPFFRKRGRYLRFMVVNSVEWSLNQMHRGEMLINRESEFKQAHNVENNRAGLDVNRITEWLNDFAIVAHVNPAEFVGINRNICAVNQNDVLRAEGSPK